MQEAANGTIQVTLMGAPRVTTQGVQNPDLERINASPDALELLALLVLSLLTVKRDGFDPLKTGVEHDADRKRLVACLVPDLLAQDAKRARDRFTFVLKELDAKLKIRTSPVGQGRRAGAHASPEHKVFGVTLAHLSIDVRSILRSARHLHDETHQDRVIARGEKRLLEGMAYPWLDQPDFQELRRSLDDCYLDALLGKVAGLRVKMESALALGDLDQAESYRSRGLPLIEKGMARLRSLDGPHPCAARMSDLEARFAHLIPAGDARTPRKTPSHAIPRRATSFVGRGAEMKKLAEVLATDRIVTITGIGGCGKTRLALMAAADHAERAHRHAWLVELAGVIDPSAVPHAVAHALKLTEQRQRTITDALIDFFRATPGLLLLDNCEHLLDGCAPLAETLTQFCPDLTILATSRQKLNIEGEYVFRLDTLRVPPTDPAAYETPDPVATLLEYASARLFVDRVRLHNDFPIMPEHVLPIAAVCASLDGIPLALELAAARAAALSLTEIQELLTDRFQLLTGGKATSLPRHKTLRAVVDWSYDLLTEREQALLCRLSVFAGGWTLEGACAVGSSEDMTDRDIVDLLTSLIDKSLVTREEAVAQGRYRMLETVRQYAGDRLREQGGTLPARRRHRNYFAGLAREAEPHLRGLDQGTWLSRLETEHDNLREALAWCKTEAEESFSLENAAVWLGLCTALRQFWDLRGHYAEGRRQFDRALELTEGMDGSLERVCALNAAGTLAWRQSDYVAMRVLAEASLAGARRIEAPNAMADALGTLSALAKYQGDSDAARRLCGESLSIRRRIGDRQGIASSLGNLGCAAHDQGDFPAAQSLYAESLTIRREIGDWQGVAGLLGNLGLLAANQGDDEAAQALHQESLEISRQTGNRQSISNALKDLGEIALRRGDDDTARAMLQESLSLYSQCGDQLGIANALVNLGKVAAHESDYDAAWSFYKDSLKLLRRIGYHVGMTDALEELARIIALDGDALWAGRIWGAAAAWRAAMGWPLSAVDQKQMEKRLAQARSLIGEDAFAAALAAGRLLTLDQMAEEALTKR